MKRFKSSFPDAEPPHHITPLDPVALSVTVLGSLSVAQYHQLSYVNQCFNYTSPVICRLKWGFGLNNTTALGVRYDGEIHADDLPKALLHSGFEDGLLATGDRGENQHRWSLTGGFPPSEAETIQSESWFLISGHKFHLSLDDQFVVLLEMTWKHQVAFLCSGLQATSHFTGLNQSGSCLGCVHVSFKCRVRDFSRRKCCI